MRIRELCREIVSAARSAIIPSLLTVIVVAIMCIAALTTVGQSAASLAAMAHQLDESGTRKLMITDANQQGFINPRTLSSVSGLTSVESVIALGTPIDTTNGAIGAGGTKTPMWTMHGKLESVATLTYGRAPRVGEAIISNRAQKALGLAQPLGFLTSASGEQFPITGVFAPTPGNDDLANGALVVAGADEPSRQLRVVIADAQSVAPTVSAVMQILNPQSMQGVHLESPTELAKTARNLTHQLATAGQQLLFSIMAIGAVFVAIVILADVLIHRRDLGRRRTLGITRSALIALVAGRTTLTAGIGAGIGCMIGYFWNMRTAATPVDFCVAVGILATTAALISALLPAWYAATRDPVAVMRTP